MNGLEDEMVTMDKCVRLWDEILKLSETVEVDEDGQHYLGKLKDDAIHNLFPKYIHLWNHDCPLCHFYKKSAECPLAITQKEYRTLHEGDDTEEHECYVGCQEKYGFNTYMKPEEIESFLRILKEKQKEILK